MWTKGVQYIFPAIFRVVVSLLILTDIATGLLYTVDFYQNPDFIYYTGREGGFLETLRENIRLFLVAYGIVILAFLFGIGKNFTAMLVFCFYFLEWLLLQPYSFVGDRFLRTSLLFFVFVNSFQYLSLSKRQAAWMPEQLSSLAVISLMLHTGLLYLANGIAKLRHRDWQQGKAMDYFFNFSEEMDILGFGKTLSEYDVIFPAMGYVTIIFQLLFMIVMWVRPWKYVWMIMGVLIHGFMAIILQLYKFEIIILLHFGFFLSEKEWRNILNLHRGWILNKRNNQ
ncbi:MAG: HTTM domain-containing protein [Weeksellaceae bacterium]|nr:HTTM domain-containing protein [Weeksellaceae bacterium]